MRLIDADVLEPDADYDDGDYWAVSMAQIQNAPTIEERKTGKWVESDTDGFVCSVCRNGYRCQPTLMGKPMFEYCPVCGAKMEAET